MLNLLIKLNIFEILVNIDCKNTSAVFENDIGLLVYMIRFSLLELLDSVLSGVRYNFLKIH